MRIGSRSSWRSLSSGLRRSGRDDTLIAGHQATVRLPGLRESDSVRLTLSTAPHAPLTRVIVSRGGRPVAWAALSEAPSVLDTGPGAGADIAIAADTTATSSAGLYRLHAIVVRRPGPLARIPALLPAALGLLALLALRARQGTARAGAWAIATIAAATVVGVWLDPLAAKSLARASQDRALLVAVALGALAALGEPGFRSRTGPRHVGSSRTDRRCRR